MSTQNYFTIHASKTHWFGFLEKKEGDHAKTVVVDVYERLDLFLKISDKMMKSSALVKDLTHVHQPTFISFKKKIERLVTNYLVSIRYDAAKEEVLFIPNSPPIKWRAGKHLCVYSHQNPYLTHSNGIFSYACSDIVYQYNLISGIQTNRSYPELNQITTLAEGVEEDLLIGGINGKIYAREKYFDTRIQQGIQSIIDLANGNYLISWGSKKEQEIFNVNSDSLIPEIKLYCPVILENQKVADLEENKQELTIYKGALLKDKEKLKFIYENEILKIEREYREQNSFHNISDFKGSKIISIKYAYSYTLCLISDKQDLIFYDVEEFSFEYVQNEELAKAYKDFIRPAPTLLGDKNHLAYSLQKKCIKTYSKAGHCSYLNELPGAKWFVNCITTLSNGFIACGTNSSNAGIYTMSVNGQVETIENNLNADIYSIKELTNGSLFVISSSVIKIFKPIIQSEDEIWRAIQQLHSQLDVDPHNFSLYDELASCYQADSTHQYQIYTLASKFAIKQNNFYKARRFYEKALMAAKDKPQFVEKYLNFSQSFKGISFIKQIQKDCYFLTKNASYLSQERKKTSYKKRLFVGEGTFSFTEALIEKHKNTRPHLSQAITATELNLIESLSVSFTEALIEKHKNTHPHLSQAITATELNLIERASVLERIQKLQAEGVKILFGIDATKLHDHFSRQRFERIQWNCPFGGTSHGERERFKSIIPQFFQSCSSLQLEKDRVHVTLVQEKAGGSGYWKNRQIENPIVKGSKEAGYRLIRKRRFDQNRYPLYQHNMTGKLEGYQDGDQKREFVFEKMPLSEVRFSKHPKKDQDLSQKEYQVLYDEGSKKSWDDYYFDCSTDEDSSDYEDGEEEVVVQAQGAAPSEYNDLSTHLEQLGI